MHRHRFRDAARRADHACPPRPPRPMLAREGLRVALARSGLVSIAMRRVRAPRRCLVARDPNRLSPRLPPPPNCVVAAAHNRRHDGCRAVSHGRPHPPLCLGLAHHTPHVVHLGVASALQRHGNVLWGDGAQACRVNPRPRGFGLVKFPQSGGGTTVQHPRGIAHPPGLATHGDEWWPHLRHTAAVAVVTQHTPPSTRRMLAQVTRGAAVCLPACDDRRAVAVGTSDRATGHEPLLAISHGPEEAQCAITLRPSPLLEHYPHMQHTPCRLHSGGRMWLRLANRR